MSIYLEFDYITCTDIHVLQRMKTADFEEVEMHVD